MTYQYNIAVININSLTQDYEVFLFILAQGLCTYLIIYIYAHRFEQQQITTIASN